MGIFINRTLKLGVITLVIICTQHTRSLSQVYIGSLVQTGYYNVLNRSSLLNDYQRNITSIGFSSYYIFKKNKTTEHSIMIDYWLDFRLFESNNSSKIMRANVPILYSIKGINNGLLNIKFSSGVVINYIELPNNQSDYVFGYAIDFGFQYNLRENSYIDFGIRYCQDVLFEYNITTLQFTTISIYLKTYMRPKSLFRKSKKNSLKSEN